MQGEKFSIGGLAARSGTKVQTVRWYEQVGMLPEPARTAGNQRMYTRGDLDRLIFIRRGRELGFSLDEVRRLLSLADRVDLSCEEADVIASAHLEEVRQKIGQLRSLEAELERMLGQCRHGTVSDCRVIEALSQGKKD
ncbi:MerR family transcriptional regulator [Indioceanicola profundi]|uniref:MerR family transcriptional regulator n=1 Tax=Indioceanicola profundi TaxID=2220096 RepID=UPI000E6ACEFF|nr:helix-turn-helix domain-containing protein [Indioceanicola profundi]